MTPTSAQAEYVTAHTDLHSEQGTVRGDRASRAKNPVIKVEGLAWLEFEKPDLNRAEAFARDFGLAVHARTDDTLYLRGALPGTHALVVRRGPQSRFLGAAFRAGSASDLQRLAGSTGSSVESIPGQGGGRAVSLLDPSGFTVQVVHGV